MKRNRIDALLREFRDYVNYDDIYPVTDDSDSDSDRRRNNRRNKHRKSRRH
jgi:hypothetical protein